MSAVLHWLWVNVPGNLVAQAMISGPAFLHLHLRLTRLTAPGSSTR